MTICIAIKCEGVWNKRVYPCVLFASDTQSSTSLIKRSSTKLQLIVGKETGKAKLKRWCFAVAISGDASVAQEALRGIQSLLYSKIAPDEENISVGVGPFLQEIGDVAYNTYKKYRDRGDDPQFEILLGAADAYAEIYHITCMGKVYETDDYAIIGSGAITGGELLIKEFLDKNPSESSASALATLVVSEVSLVDMYVGGEPQMLLCRDRNVWELNEKEYREICEESKARWDLLKRAWRKMENKKKLKEEIKQLVSK